MVVELAFQQMMVSGYLIWMDGYSWTLSHIYMHV